MINIRNLTFRYQADSEPVLNNLSLKIDPGESICIMGSNGSGKSTLAKLVASLLTPSEGRVDLDCADHPLPVAFLFQNPDNQFVAATVEKELAFSLENLGIDQKQMESIVNNTLNTFSIEPLRSRLISELSGGEKQRVALASVVAQNAPILILDEPDSYLDIGGRQILEQELRRLRTKRPQMIEIRITQYPSVAKKYKRLIVMSQGKILADNTPENIFADQNLLISSGLLSLGNDQVDPIQPFLKKSTTKNLQTIRLCDTSFGYEANTEIIHNLAFSINRSEILGLVGPSAAGKSSLAFLLCGLVKPTSGKVEYFDDTGNAIDLPDIVGHVTASLQFPERQFFLPTCNQEIEFGPTNMKQKLSESDRDRLFDFCHLDSARFGERDPFSLSVGEKRKLAFGAVLSIAPDFLIFDEPTCGLDPAGVTDFIAMASALKKGGTGLILISHDGNLISTLCDRVLYLDGHLGHSLYTKEQFKSDPSVRQILNWNQD